MDFLKKALADAGYLGGGRTLDDALVTNAGIIRDRHGKPILKLEKAANGVDIAIVDYYSNRVIDYYYL